MQPPIDITQQAIGEHVKAFANEIGRDKSLVYKWLGDPEVDPYTRMVAVLTAAYKVNPAGAELFALDFTSRHDALRDGEFMRGAEWVDVVSDALVVTNDAMAEAVKRGSDLEVKVARAIRALRWLLTQERADVGAA